MAQVTLLFILCLHVCSTNTEIFFQEQFKDGDGWKNRWVQSGYRADYGKFNLSNGQFYNDPFEDLGLTTSEDMKFYAISAKFPAFSNKDKQLIIQYAVKRKFLPEIDCGGLYLKILKSDIDQKNFHEGSSYQIMFGPDSCGITSKLHAILRYKGVYHHLNVPLFILEDELTHVYTLIIYPNNSIEILVDNEKQISGDLEDYYDFLPPRKINDPEAKKPSDWVDDEFIDDPEDRKPDDWDKPRYILDENATKPDDWDDEMDGEWELPYKENSEYKGQWRARRIKNPAYKGEWQHPQIDNPNYKPDPNLYLHEDLGTVGIEIWQANCGTTYDNIIITDSKEEAKNFSDLTLKVTRKGEEEMKRAFDEVMKKKQKHEEDQKMTSDGKEDIEVEFDEEDKKFEEEASSPKEEVIKEKEESMENEMRREKTEKEEL